MLYSTIFLAASALSGLAAAQTSIDPNSVSSTDRANWCRAETNTCPVLCGGTYSNNTCEQASLEYSCVCRNGMSPNVSDYQNTIPAFVCQAWKGQCLAQNAGNATAQEACQAVQCGTKTASNLVASSTSSSAASSSAAASGSSSASATSGSAASQTASGSATASASAGAANALNVGKEYGASVLVASLFGLFAYAL